MKVLTQKKHHKHVPCSYAFKVVCIDNKYSKPIVVYRGVNAAYKFVKAILEERKYCKKIMKDQFNKNLIMTEEEEHLFHKVIIVGFVKRLLIMMMKKLEIIVI